MKGIRYIQSESDIVYILKLCYTVEDLKFGGFYSFLWIDE